MTASGGPDRAADILEQLESNILGQPLKFTRLEVADRAGVRIEVAAQLWRALGFASPGDDEKVFSDADIRALELLSAFAELGGIDGENVSALARTVGQSFARLAEWQIEILSEAVGRSDDNRSAPKKVLQLVDVLVPLMEQLQTYVWRRHLATAASRLWASPSEDEPTTSLVVGFADIVNYTSISRRMDEHELLELIEHFEATASAIVTNHHGRVVKTIGDEIMFVAGSPEDGARLALDIASRGEGVALRPLRIGLAYGHVLSRLGDVYGPVVNIAARLTSVARPGTVMVDRNLADQLSEKPDYHLRKARRVSVRGYSRLEPWVLRAVPPEKAARA